MSQSIDCYRILQIHPQADRAQVAAAYRRLSKIYHPDINHAAGAEAMMKNINAAYHILKDEGRRREYDQKHGYRPRFSPGTPGFSAWAAARAAQGKGGFAWQAPPRTAPPRAEPSRAETQAETQAEAEARAEAESRRSPEAAARVMAQYLEHLRSGEHEKAYGLLCLHDRQYVTLPSFCKWRQSVGRLFIMREFEIVGGEDVAHFRMDESSVAPARKISVNVTEKNMAKGTIDRYQFVKHTVLEYGKWQVFLGYRDLGEIAKVFEDLSHRQEQGEMARKWEEYCRHTCRELDMLSLEGLIHQADKEIYRCRRYGQSMTVALYSVRPQGQKTAEEALGALVDICAQTLVGGLRQTDIPAYIGGGIFAVLYIEMKRRSARGVLSDMAERMRQEVLRTSGWAIKPRYVHTQYEDGSLQDCLDALGAQLEKD